MKKAAYIPVTILETLCLAGIWTIQYFTRRKMGIAWYVVYENRSWEAGYPMELLVNGTVLLIVVLTVMLLLYFLRQRRNLTKTMQSTNAGMIVLTFAYGGLTWMNSADEVQAYYFISAILGGVSLIQVAKTWTGMLVCRHSRRGMG